MGTFGGKYKSNDDIMVKVATKGKGEECVVPSPVQGYAVSPQSLCRFLCKISLRSDCTRPLDSGGHLF